MLFLEKIESVQTGAEAPADLDKPTCTPSSKIVQDEVISVYRKEKGQVKLWQEPYQLARYISHASRPAAPAKSRSHDRLDNHQYNQCPFGSLLSIDESLYHFDASIHCSAK